jgi:hypothetical protein
VRSAPEAPTSEVPPATKRLEQESREQLAGSVPGVLQEMLKRARRADPVAGRNVLRRSEQSRRQPGKPLGGGEDHRGEPKEAGHLPREESQPPRLVQRGWPTTLKSRSRFELLAPEIIEVVGIRSDVDGRGPLPPTP